MPTKAKSLTNLRDWGYNTPEFLIFDADEHDLEDLMTLATGGRLGIRTSLNVDEGITSFSLPFLYDLTPVAAYHEVLRLSLSFVVIVTKIIPPELSLLSANIILSPSGGGTVEYLKGPSLGRDVDTAKYGTLQRTDFSYISQLQPPALHELVEYCSGIPELVGRKIVIEATHLKEPAGSLGERNVVWEYRDAA